MISIYYIDYQLYVKINLHTKVQFLLNYQMLFG